MRNTVKLNSAEVAFGKALAAGRNADALKAGRSPLVFNFSEHEPPEIRHVTGCLAELAVAKYFDLYPNTASYRDEKSRGGYDLSHHIFVRGSARYRNLAINSGDKDGRYVAAFVTGGHNMAACDVELIGWITGRDAKRREWIRRRDGARVLFVAPECALLSIEALYRKINGIPQAIAL